MKLIDCHNHSKYSFDADFSVAQMCESAEKNGLIAFAITDHCEVNSYEQHQLATEIPKSLLEINALKGCYGKMRIIAGIELGQLLQDPARACELLKLDGLDFVIGSLHNSKNELDFYFVDFINSSQEQLMLLFQKYYQELYEMAGSCDFDVLGHLTYPFRYLCQAKAKNPSIIFESDFLDEIISETLSMIIQKGKGIEINTSGLFQAIGETLPSEKYLKMYFQLGGEILSIGSDAHTPQNVGAGIVQATNLAKRIGFQYLTYFENRKPIMIKI